MLFEIFEFKSKKKNNKIKNLLQTKSFLQYILSIKWIFPFDKIEKKIKLFQNNIEKKEFIIVYPEILKKSFYYYFLLFQKYINIKYSGVNFKIMNTQDLFIEYFYNSDFIVNLKNKIFFFTYTDFIFFNYSYYIDFFINTKNNNSLLLLNEEINNLIKQKNVNILETSEYLKKTFNIIDDKNNENIIKNNFDIENNSFINIFAFLSILKKDQFYLYSECLSHKKYKNFLSSFYLNNHFIKNSKLDIFISNYIPQNLQDIQLSKIIFSKGKNNNFYLFKNKYHINININKNSIKKNTLYLKIIIDNYNELSFGDLLMISKIIKNKIKAEFSLFLKKIVFIVDKRKDLILIIKNNLAIRKSLIPLLRKNKKNFLINVFLYENKYLSIDLDFIYYRLKILNIDIKFFKVFHKLKIILLTDYNKLIKITTNNKDNNYTCDILIKEIFKIEDNSSLTRYKPIKIIFEILYIFQSLFIEYKQYQEKNIILFGKNKDGYLNYVKALDKKFCFLLKDFFFSLGKIHLNKTEKITINNINVENNILGNI